MTTGKCGNWVETFPGNLRWSNATQIVKGMVPWAAAAMGEIDAVVQRLQAREHDGEPDRAWSEEWGAMGDKVAKIADTAAAEGREITAGNNYMRAGNYFYSAERFIAPGPDKMAMYQKALRCYRAALQRLHPNVEVVDVPYEEKSLAAYFMKAPGTTGRAPTVVLFDGMDNCKEMSVIFAGIEFAKRGFIRLRSMGRGRAKRSACARSTAGPTTRCRAPLPTTTWRHGRTSMRSGSPSWDTASAATKRRASPRSSSATPPASRWARCIGICTIGRRTSRRASPRTRRPASPRTSSFAG